MWLRVLKGLLFVVALPRCLYWARTRCPGYLVHRGRQGDSSGQVEKRREDALLLTHETTRNEMKRDVTKRFDRHVDPFFVLLPYGPQPFGV